MLAILHPWHTRSTVAVGGGVAGGDIVGARQVVVRQGLKVEDVIVAIAGADRSRRLVEGTTNEEMGAGEYPLPGAFREARLPTHDAILLGVHLIPVLGREVL